jgi:hypothetical protein
MRNGDIASLKRSAVFNDFINDLTLAVTSNCELHKFGDVRSIAGIMHGIAKLGLLKVSIDHNSNEFIPHNSNEVIPSNIPNNIPNNVAAIAKSVENNSEWIVEFGEPQEISLTAWSFATLGIPASKLFQNIDQRSTVIVVYGTPQNIANTAWACATLGISCPKLFKNIEEQTILLVENGTTH